MCDFFFCGLGANQQTWFSGSCLLGASRSCISRFCKFMDLELFVWWPSLFRIHLLPLQGIFSTYSWPPSNQSASTTCTSDSSYQCLECPRVFATRTGLEMHVKNKHRGIYPYVCQLCGRGFSSTTHMRGHMASHTGVKEYRCAVCGKEYAYKSDLRVHVKSLHGAGNMDNEANGNSWCTTGSQSIFCQDCMVPSIIGW